MAHHRTPECWPYDWFMHWFMREAGGALPALKQGVPNRQCEAGQWLRALSVRWIRRHSLAAVPIGNTPS